MTELDVCEFNAREGAKFALDGLLQARARAHALLLVLLGGSAGMASTGVALMASENPMLSTYVAWSAVASAALWCWLAGRVVLGSLMSSEVHAWAAKADSAMLQQWRDYAVQVLLESGKPASALDEMRISACDVAAEAAKGYRAASGPAYLALDRAYINMAATPLVWVNMCLALWLLQRLG